MGVRGHALELCRAHSSLAATKGDLTAKCQQMVKADGFRYKKGKSRAGHSPQGAMELGLVARSVRCIACANRPMKLSDSKANNKWLFH